MIHYSCDRCGKFINPQVHVRYEVRIEVTADLQPVEDTELDEDRDYLQEIDAYLQEHGGDEEPAPDDTFCRSFDLCEECYKKYIKNPLGAPVPASVSFSPN